MAAYCALPASVKRHEDLTEAEVTTLVLAAQTGDPHAFAELYRLYYQRMYLWMRSHAPDPGDAEDLVQELFTRLLTELPDYQPREGSPFVAWLYGGAKLTLRHHGWSWTEQQGAPAEAEADRLLRGHDDPDTQELSGPVSAALASLPAGQRRNVELRYLDGLPRPTVSAVLGCTTSAVNNSCSEALKKLRRQLAGLAPARRQAAQPVEGSTVFTLKDAAVHCGRSRSGLSHAAAEGRLVSYWRDGQRVVTADDLAAYLARTHAAAPVASVIPRPRTSPENADPSALDGEVAC
ncbi:RNA polymerase sigma factor [Amycolatopsis jejuensis]|uniref:RNA polymerase sigma factor n=1 Tax=Amycolatopsis jejuensis TaxID=330084 RepID=UPI0012E05E99|nr:sigma-70 family RNA polymerase sigma factor [Amycolatopsis jejuensis]